MVPGGQYRNALGAVARADQYLAGCHQDVIDDVIFAGAITVAQKPETAKQLDMPRRAVNSGCVDFVFFTKDISS